MRSPSKEQVPFASPSLVDQLASQPPRRIVAFAREHLGDVVNTTGAILALRARFPHARLTVEVGERAADLVRRLPGVDEVWERPTRQGLFGKLAFVRRLRRGRFDLAAIFDDSSVMVLYAWLAGISTRVGVWRGKRYRGLFSAYVPYRTDRCETRDNFAEMLRLLGVERVPPPQIAIDDRDRLEADALLSGREGPLVGLQPGASLESKKWPIERFAELAASLRGVGVIVLGSAGERNLARTIIARRADAIDLTGKTTVGSLAAVCSRLVALVTNDTGTMHVAATSGCPVVALFGPTDPVAYRPWGEGHRILTGACFCPQRDPGDCQGDCLRSISVEEVLEAVDAGRRARFLP